MPKVDWFVSSSISLLVLYHVSPKKDYFQNESPLSRTQCLYIVIWQCEFYRLGFWGITNLGGGGGEFDAFLFCVFWVIVWGNLRF